MEYIFTYIANYGFPMVVASFLLFRMDKHLANLEEVICTLSSTQFNYQHFFFKFPIFYWTSIP